ncbi:MAG: D-alanyl-D-alanine carboxypeptidase family protein [Rhodocyclaceae bacterium]
MSIRILLLFAALALSALARAQGTPVAPEIAARAFVLLDHGSGQVLAERKADERVEPASLTKIMTAYLAFAALRDRTLDAGQTLTISQRAWKSTGSRMFIDPAKPVGVEELLRGMIIQSGNDASVALAEAIAGTEEAFAEKMNREAQRLGLKNTHFTNATGLPDPQHYTTARDMALLASAMIRDFPERYRLHAEKEYTHNRIRQPNRNRLLWLDPTVDGVKTGHTDAAGYCLVASSRRGPRRLISVVMGSASDQLRSQESLKLLNFGFQAYDTVVLYKAGQALSAMRVWKGDKRELRAGFANDFVLSLPKGQAARLKAELASRQPLIAPVAAGAQVGTLRLTLDGRSIGEYPVRALEGVPLAGWFGRVWDTIRLWFQ